MSVAEIRQQIAGLSMEERLDLAAWITHLNRADDLEYQRDLDGRLDRMQSGHKSTLNDLEKLHEHLAAKRLAS